MEKIGQAGSFGTYVSSGNHLRLNKFGIGAVLMLLCVAPYYDLWFRYTRSGQAFPLLWTPFLFIAIPRAVLPVGAFGFAALWGRSVWLGAATVMLAIGHIGVPWIS